MRIIQVVIILAWIVFNPTYNAQGRLRQIGHNHEKSRRADKVLTVTPHGKIGLAKVEKSVISAPAAYDTVGDFCNGIAIVGRGERVVNQFGKLLSDYAYGYVNRQGRLIVPARYRIVNPFSDSLGLIETDPDGSKNYQFVDAAGRRVLNHLPYYECSSFSGGTAYVETDVSGFWLPPYSDGRDNGKFKQLYDVDGRLIWGNYIDKRGNLLIPAVYDTLAPYVSGCPRPARKGGKWGLLNEQADPFVDFRYDDMKYLLTQHIWVKLNRKWGCLNALGQLIIPFEYKEVRSLKGDMAAVKKSKYWSVMDSTGRLLTVANYDTVFDFSNDRAIVKINQKYGFINTQGREIIKPIYNRVSPFFNKCAFATVYGLFITLDHDGNWVKVRMTRGVLKISMISIFLLVLLGWVWYEKKHKSLLHH